MKGDEKVKEWKRGLSYKEVADRYSVHVNTVRSWVLKGWLKPTHFAGRVYFSEQACVAFEHRKEK